MKDTTYCDPKGKTASAVKLTDCGKIIRIHNTDLGYNFSAKIQMVIKTPRGTLVIYHNRTNHYHKAGKAIKAFMKAYKND